MQRTCTSLCCLPPPIATNCASLFFGAVQGQTIGRDCDDAGGRDEATAVPTLVLSSACGLLLRMAAGETDFVAANAGDWLSRIDADPTFEPALDSFLADLRPDVSLTGRQLILAVVAAQASACLQLCSVPVPPPAHLAAADACVARLLAQDPLRSRHYHRLSTLRCLQDRGAEAVEAMRTELRLATAEEGGSAWCGRACGWLAGTLRCLPGGRASSGVACAPP